LAYAGGQGTYNRPNLMPKTVKTPPSIIRLNQSSGVPIAKQIVDQIKFMIEDGQLRDGETLPSSRMLASNLRINRNTVAAAYSRLSADGYVESRNKAGMVVTGAEDLRRRAETRKRATQSLRSAVEECLELGMSSDGIASLAYHYGLHSERLEVRLGFVECNRERVDYFAKELSDRLSARVVPILLADLNRETMAEIDLLLTTFFHLAEVRRVARGRAPDVPDVVAIVVAPHVQTLVRLAQIPPSHRIGILYSTQEQATGIRDSLSQTGLHNLDVLESGSDIDPSRFDVVIIPSEMPALGDPLRGKVEIVEFGNVLDEASIRMVQQVVGDIQDRNAASLRVVTRPPEISRTRRVSSVAGSASAAGS
jgi:GntR family transcriptional regulator